MKFCIKKHPGDAPVLCINSENETFWMMFPQIVRRALELKGQVKHFDTMEQAEDFITHNPYVCKPGAEVATLAEDGDHMGIRVVRVTEPSMWR